MKNFILKGGSAERLESSLVHLAKGKELPPWLRDHQLRGKMRQYRELHVEPDWLLVYEKDGKTLRIFCIWLVTHKKLRERQRSL